jgi:outer membrane receptor protein involved in Fe transport
MKTEKTYCKKPLALAIGGILAGTSPLAAAQTADTGGGVIEEIVVTATRREQSILDIPYNITAISGDAIEDAKIVDNMELMREVAGASVVDRGYRNVGVINSIMIRGLNIDGSALGDYALNTVPTVSTYVNDTPIYANFILKDLERVEVLRGPQGTLYGSGSLGGTVRYITRAPSTEGFEGEISGSISQTEGSEGENYSLDLVLNAPLSDNAAFRLAAGTLQNDGIVDYVNVYELDSDGIPVAPNGILDPAASFRRVEDADDVDITYARAALFFEPNEIFNFTLSYHTQSDDIGGRRQQTTGTDAAGNRYGEYEIGSIQLEPSSRDVDLASLEAEFDLGFGTKATASAKTRVFTRRSAGWNSITTTTHDRWPRPCGPTLTKPLCRNFVSYPKATTRLTGLLVPSTGTRTLTRRSRVSCAASRPGTTCGPAIRISSSGTRTLTTSATRTSPTSAYSARSPGT